MTMAAKERRPEHISPDVWRVGRLSVSSLSASSRHSGRPWREGVPSVARFTFAATLCSTLGTEAGIL